MIKFTQKGNWSKTDSFLEKALEVVKLGQLDRYGQEGVRILAENTPKDTGKTAESWYYKIVRTKNSAKIQWLNSNLNNGVPIAILIQYGHALLSGDFVEGNDFINPAMKPLFDSIANEIRKELGK